MTREITPEPEAVEEVEKDSNSDSRLAYDARKIHMRRLLATDENFAERPHDTEQPGHFQELINPSHFEIDTGHSNQRQQDSRFIHDKKPRIPPQGRREKQMPTDDDIHLGFVPQAQRKPDSRPSRTDKHREERKEQKRDVQPRSQPSSTPHQRPQSRFNVVQVPAEPLNPIVELMKLDGTRESEEESGIQGDE
ncbi:hypothetical protein H0H93_015272 [Arthromyces matolae]|nr:hypothetical protein H0H93_015272 [Arthromyces matolae]